MSLPVIRFRRTQNDSISEQSGICTILMKYFQQKVTSTNYKRWSENKFTKPIVTRIKEPTLVVVMWQESQSEYHLLPALTTVLIVIKLKTIVLRWPIKQDTVF